jgi:hypothetical protein
MPGWVLLDTPVGETQPYFKAKQGKRTSCVQNDTCDVHCAALCFSAALPTRSRPAQEGPGTASSSSCARCSLSSAARPAVAAVTHAVLRASQPATEAGPSAVCEGMALPNSLAIGPRGRHPCGDWSASTSLSCAPSAGPWLRSGLQSGWVAALCGRLVQRFWSCKAFVSVNILFFRSTKKNCSKRALVAHVSNSSTWETEAGRSQVLGQPGLPRETLFLLPLLTPSPPKKKIGCKSNTLGL